VVQVVVVEVNVEQVVQEIHPQQLLVKEIMVEMEVLLYLLVEAVVVLVL
jgi:hypothetical protein